GIRDLIVTGVQTCALPICPEGVPRLADAGGDGRQGQQRDDAAVPARLRTVQAARAGDGTPLPALPRRGEPGQDGRARRLLDRRRSEERRVGKEWRFVWRPW